MRGKVARNPPIPLQIMVKHPRNFVSSLKVFVVRPLQCLVLNRKYPSVEFGLLLRRMDRRVRLASVSNLHK